MDPPLQQWLKWCDSVLSSVTLLYSHHVTYNWRLPLPVAREDNVKAEKNVHLLLAIASNSFPSFPTPHPGWITLTDWFHLTLRPNLPNPTPNTWVSTLHAASVINNKYDLFYHFLFFVGVGLSQWTSCPWSSPTFAAAFCLLQWCAGGSGTTPSLSHFCM